MGKAQPSWVDEFAADVTASFDDVHLYVEPEPAAELVADPKTMRRAAALSRVIDRDPSIHPQKVQLFLTEFDKLLAQKFAQLQTKADTAVIARLRERAAV